MTEEEKVPTETWSMDALVEFRGKAVKFQFCELTEKEEPKFTGISERMAEDKKMQMYQELGSKRILRMLLKANKKQPDGPAISQEQWALLPTTLRYQISNTIMDGYSASEISKMAKDKPEIRQQYHLYLETRRKYDEMIGVEKKVGFGDIK